MALFSRTKKEKTEDTVATPKETKVKKEVVSNALPTDLNLSSVILKPRITEKAVAQHEKLVYTFVVRRDATKHMVEDAIKMVFKVTPVKVNIVNKTPRQFKSKAKGRSFTEKGMKKAYVYLKKGDRIDLV